MSESRPLRKSSQGDPAVYETPALLVDLERLDRNIQRMAASVTDAGLSLRPHFKAHKCIEIVRRQMDAGTRGFTAATVDEALALVDAGVNDILVATQVVSPNKLRRALSSSRGKRLVMAVDSGEGISTIAAVGRELQLTVDVAIEIDSGLHRCGVPPEQSVPLARIVASTSGLKLAGVFTHAGHAYAADSVDKIRAVAMAEAQAVRDAAIAIRESGLSVELVSVGSTPTSRASVSRDMVTETRPGNYVFMDGIQVALGVASADECALLVAATVISRPAPTRVVVDAGSKTLGLDRGAHSVRAMPHFGAFVGEPGHLEWLSEEHGVALVPRTSRLKVGDEVRIRPNHACAAANLAQVFYVVRDDRVVATWPVSRGVIHSG